MDKSEDDLPRGVADTGTIAGALAKAQGELGNASKNAANPHYKSKYADLAELLNTIRPVMSRHGIAVVQMPSYADGVVSVETVLMHSSGQSIRCVSASPVAKMDAQGIGSVITYLRRYSLAAMCGIAQEDEDGNAASGRADKAKPPYPADKFAENLPKWQALIEAGQRTPDDIIRAVTTSAVMSIDQVSAIRALGGAK